MVTSVIGKMFLDAYNRKYNTSYDAEHFFLERFYPMFFDNNKYLYWVQNSPFVQMSKGQNVETLTADERKDKLCRFVEKVNNGVYDASIAIGYPASEEKDYATTSGQVTNLQIPVSKEDVYCSWFGSALGVGVQGGFSILFYNPDILMDIYEGWYLYRKALDNTINLPGNKIMTWNGQWLYHRYGNSYDSADPMADFHPFTMKNNEFGIETVSWTKILTRISCNCNEMQIMGYVYTYGQTNTTIGFIPFDLSEIDRPVRLYKKFFGISSGNIAEKLWGTALGLKKSCQSGVVGIKAMEPKGFRESMESGKIPVYSEDEDKKMNFNVYKIWIMAMLNNQDLWDKASEFASVLYNYGLSETRAKTEKINKVKAVLEATGKTGFMKNLVNIAEDAENVDKIEDIASTVNNMPSDNVMYFMTLIRFQYAILNNKSK